MPTLDKTARWRASDPKQLGRALARIRKEQGLRQQDLAARAGIHRSYLAELEIGTATEQLQRIFLLLRELGYELVLRPKGEGNG